MTKDPSLFQAAIILKSLPKPQAALILSRLEPADIKTVIDAINQIDCITADQISEALERLNRETSRTWESTESTQKLGELLGTTIQQEAAETPKPSETQPAPFSESKLDPDHPFAFVIHSLPIVRDQLLETEPPRNIALMLSTLPPNIASDCMKSLDPAVRVSVLQRLCELDGVSQEEIAQFRYALRLRHQKLMTRHQYRTTGLRSAAALLSCTDPNTTESMLEVMGQDDPDLAATLGQAIVKVEDLAALQDQDIQVLLKHVDTACWAPALKKAPLAVQEAILKNMADAPAQILSREMEAMDYVDESLQFAARKEIMRVVVQLTEEEKIKIPRKRDEPSSSDQARSPFPAIGSGTFLDPITSPIN